VQGLHQADFQVKEDGRPVTVTSFAEVSAAGISGRADARSVVLLLDDTGIGPTGTLRVQDIARLFMARARPVDDVAVVRLTQHQDEAVGDLQEALTRIAEYRGGTLPFFGRESIENALKTVATVARELEPLAHRRKNLVCIGARSLCDLYLRQPENSLVWASWVDALSAAARANASVYIGDGLVENTGGEDFVRSNNFARAVDLIWAEASHYYLLGYTPTARARPLHTIEVKIRRGELHVRARRSRGD
jgi:hypothetical protein